MDPFRSYAFVYIFVKKSTLWCFLISVKWMARFLTNVENSIIVLRQLIYMTKFISQTLRVQTWPQVAMKMAKIGNFNSYRAFLVLLGIATLLLIILLKSKPAGEYLTNPIIFLYTIFVTSFELSRLVSAMLYKSVDTHLDSTTKKNLAYANEQYEPTVSFVIPCKDEGASIERTIDKCFEAHYPEYKLEVIVIDDGSTDNTYEVLKKCQLKYPKLQIIHWDKNRGKRHGM